MVERPGAMALGTFLGGSGFGNDLATAVFRAELGQGFTVLRQVDGQVSFGLGVVEKGRRPAVPFELQEGQQVIQANERVELRPEQRDFAGPFQVREGEELWLAASVEGVEAVDVLLLDRAKAEAWLGEGLREPTLGPPGGLPVYSEVLRSGARLERSLRLGPGEYFLVLDHASSAGAAKPPATAPGASGAAVVSFALSTGEAR
jgi:hypothetical protein